MIVSKTAAEIPLSGGGTDLDFFINFGSKFISATVTEMFMFLSKGN